MLRALIRLPRTIWLLSLVSLFNDTASELVYPIVPLYLAAVLGAGPRTLGLIEGIAEATGSLLKLFGGVMADRTRATKHWMIVGYGLSGISKPLFAFATSWPMVLVLRFADRVGKGIRSSPRDALLARSIGSHERGLAFGLHRTMDNLGAVIGPLLAALLLAMGVELRYVFLWASLGGAAAVIGSMMVQDPAREATQAKAAIRWTFTGLPPSLKRYLIVMALFTLGSSSNMFLLLRARDLGFTDAQVPLLWALVSLTASIFSAPFSALSDRIGRKPLIVLGWGVYAAFYLLYAGMSEAFSGLLWPLFVLYGLFMALTEGVEKAFVADLAPREAVGTAFGWFNLIAGVMLFPASLVFGVIWDHYSPMAAFGFSAGCAGVAAILLLVWIEAEKP